MDHIEQLVRCLMTISGDYNYRIKNIVANKVNQLWVGDSPTTSAYYKLKGVEMQNGILVNAKITPCSPTMHLQYISADNSAEALIKFRERFPKVTKEEVLECLMSIKVS